MSFQTHKTFFKDTFGWGFALWLFGYILGFALFFVVPASVLGWVLMPFGVALTLWVLYKKVSTDSFSQRITLSIVWTMLAVGLDYLFIVKALHPADGYYKLDVYVYYALTFILPLVVGGLKKDHEQNTSTISRG